MAGHRWFGVVAVCALLGACASGGDAAPTEAAIVATPVGKITAQPLRPRVEHRFGLPSPDWLGAGAGSVWVKRDDGVLTRVDPKTNKVIRNIKVQKPGSQHCQGLGTSDDSVWTCGGDGDVVRIDPATNKIVARLPLGKTTDQSFIPVLAGHAWFLIGDGSTVVGVNTTSNEVDVEIPLESGCVNLGADDTTMWAACVSNDVVLRIDPAAREVTARIGGLEAPRAISVSDEVWVLYYDGLARIDPLTAEVTGALGVDSIDGGIFATEDAVWVRADGIFLQRVDPDSLELVQVLTAPEQSGGSVIEAFGSVWATAYNDTVMYRSSIGS
jgi:streptogramin lyase